MVIKRQIQYGSEFIEIKVTKMTYSDISFIIKAI